MRNIAILIMLTLPLQGCVTLAALATVEGAICAIKLVKAAHGTYKYIKDCKEEADTP